jgi:hypothetical protein
VVRPQRGGGLKLLGATPASASVKAIIDLFDAGRNGGFAGRVFGLANDLLPILHLLIDYPAPKTGPVLFNAVFNAPVFHN